MNGKETSATINTYPKGGVMCYKVSIVVYESLVFQIKFCGKSPALRVPAIRSASLKKNER